MKIKNKNSQKYIVNATDPSRAFASNGVSFDYIIFLFSFRFFIITFLSFRWFSRCFYYFFKNTFLVYCIFLGRTHLNVCDLWCVCNVIYASLICMTAPEWNLGLEEHQRLWLVRLFEETKKRKTNYRSQSIYHQVKTTHYGNNRVHHTVCKTLSSWASSFVRNIQKFIINVISTQTH